MKDNKRDQQNQIIQLELQKKRNHQYQAKPKNQHQPSDKSASDENALKEISRENKAFYENERGKKSNRPIAGDGTSRLL